MVRLWGECPRHGSFQVGPDLDLRPGLALVIEGGVQVHCPDCGRIVPVSDFRYTGQDDGDVIVTPETELGAAQIQRLRRSLESARRQVRDGNDPQGILTQLERDIAREAPALLPVVQQAKSSFWEKASGNRAGTVLALIQTIMAIISVFLGAEALQVAMDSRQEIIDQVVEEKLREAGVVPGETSTPSPSAPTPSEQSPTPESEPPVLGA